MKKLLCVSLPANVLLCGLVFWLISHRPATAAHAPAAAAPQDSQPAFATAPEQSPSPVAQPFRWSQLESSDYHTYLANLRNIGCPEQTIRDIITADVDSVFAQRREEAERAAGNTAEVHQDLESTLQGLREQETAFLASLLGGQAEPSPVSSTKKVPSFLAQRTIRPALPLAFKEVDPAALPVSSAQLSAISDVRRTFQQELGNQDTNDPAYVQRWDKAQRDADDRLRGLLGSKFFMQYEAAVASQTAR